jgi:hypothetical protein
VSAGATWPTLAIPPGTPGSCCASGCLATGRGRVRIVESRGSRAIDREWSLGGPPTRYAEPPARLDGMGIQVGAVPVVNVLSVVRGHYGASSARGAPAPMSCPSADSAEPVGSAGATDPYGWRVRPTVCRRCGAWRYASMRPVSDGAGGGFRRLWLRQKGWRIGDARRSDRRSMHRIGMPLWSGAKTRSDEQAERSLLDDDEGQRLKREEHQQHGAEVHRVV